MTKQHRNFTFHLDAKKKYEITSQGFFKADAYFTRSGIFDYTFIENGKEIVVRELRPDDEVFHPDSMKSLQMVPISNNHPMEHISVDNFQQYQIGMTGENITQIDNFLSGKVIITDKKVIGDILMNIEQKKPIELSCGYDCNIEFKPGKHKEGDYDAIQKDIIYNHVALLLDCKGRAGKEVKLRVDSKKINTIIFKG